MTAHERHDTMLNWIRTELADFLLNQIGIRQKHESSVLYLLMCLEVVFTNFCNMYQNNLGIKESYFYIWPEDTQE